MPLHPPRSITMIETEAAAAAALCFLHPLLCHIRPTLPATAIMLRPLRPTAGTTAVMEHSSRVEAQAPIRRSSKDSTDREQADRRRSSSSTIEAEAIAATITDTKRLRWPSNFPLFRSVTHAHTYCLHISLQLSSGSRSKSNLCDELEGKTGEVRKVMFNRCVREELVELLLLRIVLILLVVLWLHVRLQEGEGLRRRSALNRGGECMSQIAMRRRQLWRSDRRVHRPVVRHR